MNIFLLSNPVFCGMHLIVLATHLMPDMDWHAMNHGLQQTIFFLY